MPGEGGGSTAGRRMKELSGEQVEVKVKTNSCEG